MRKTHLLELRHVEGTDRCEFSVIENMTFGQCKLFYEYHKLVVGKIATVACFFNDYDITNDEIVVTATKFMKGEYTRIDVNLKDLTFTEIKGLDLTNPR